MSPDALTALIIQYKYWILIPLSFIEGPIVAFVAGTLAAVGLFNIYWLALLFFVRDMGLDALYYGVGYWGGKSPFALRMLRKIGITNDHLETVRGVWEKRPFVTMFIGKLAYGIATAFIIAAGTVRLPLRYFFGYGFVVAILQYGLLLVGGYYLGSSFGGHAEKIINNISLAAGSAALVVTLYYLVAWKIRKQLIARDKEITE
jgi:membrane protein DedA with SNARE-associated domain